MKQLTMKRIRRYSAARIPAGELFKEAFPPREKIAWRIMLAYLNKPGVELWAFYEGDVFAGFAYMLLSQRYVYLLYCAVPEGLRGQGLGALMVRRLLEHYSGRSMVLDIEPVDPSAENAAQRLARFRFYERLGFQDTFWEMTDSTGDYRILTSDAADFDIEDFRAMFSLLPPLFVGIDIVSKGSNREEASL